MFNRAYSGSHAVIVGIDAYSNCPPLRYAKSDAKGVAAVLTDRYGFRPECVHTLLDKDATKAAILSLMDSFRESGSRDDRLMVFFAGHGHTVSGNKGEVGYLVPVDGHTAKLDTLIRWRELTESADVIPAKHVLFIMDACYGGLALQRYVSPGSRRFLDDMLQRHSRQVLTAGKANEQVADGGGPRAGHSVFTGHLLDALEGQAAGVEGIVTANVVMAYVFDRVAKDQNSRQTPHYGIVEGDGDFIFTDPAGLVSDPQAAKGEQGKFVVVPANLLDPEEPTKADERVEAFKELLSEPRHRIRLNDVVSNGVRTVLQQLTTENFPRNLRDFSEQPFVGRLKRYDSTIGPIAPYAVLLARWASDSQRSILANLFARLSDNSHARDGYPVWAAMSWYPVIRLQYLAGIASIAANDYASFQLMHCVAVQSDPFRPNATPAPLVVRAVEASRELMMSDTWRGFSDFGKKYVPLSEYLFTTSQPLLEDMLFLGVDYERLFDRYELLRAILCLHLKPDTGFPPGRFSWKYGTYSVSGNPLKDLTAEIDAMQDEWPPVKAGMFGGKSAWVKILIGKVESFTARLGWQ